VAAAFAVVVAVAGAAAVGTGDREVSAAPRAHAQGGPTITGGGSSFAALQLQQWRADVARAPYGLSVNYTAAGSTFGRDQYRLGLVDFGVSDIPYPEQEQGALNASARAAFVYVPVMAGAVGFMYNLTGTNGQRITNLRLTQEQVCRIFTEPGMQWDDPALVAINPGVPLPAEKIRPVVRSDSSGTSYVFSEYCIATAPDVWRAFIGRVVATNTSAEAEFLSGKPTSAWPQLGGFVTAFASDGIANTVAGGSSGRSTIAYLEAGYSVKLGLPTAFVRNGAGEFTPPNPPNSTVALGYASPKPNGTFSLQYSGPDPRAYFPSTYSYVIAQTNGFDPAKGAALGTFLNYAVTKGQERAEPLLYSRLSTVLVNLALDKVQQIPGAPARPTDLAGAPPPPQVAGAPPGSLAAGGLPGGGAGGAGGGSGGGGAGAAGGAAGGADPAADAAAAEAAAADAAAAEGAAVATDEGYSLQLTEEEAAELAEEVATGLPVSSVTGPELGEVVTYLLLGFVLVGAGTFLAQGVRTTWRHR
jgi:phosphate transport system substrate-binding protein